MLLKYMLFVHAHQDVSIRWFGKLMVSLRVSTRDQQRPWTEASYFSWVLVVTACVSRKFLLGLR